MWTYRPSDGLTPPTVYDDSAGVMIATLPAAKPEHRAKIDRNGALLAEAPAMAASLRFLRPALPALIGQALSQSELADLDALLARIDGEGGQ